MAIIIYREIVFVAITYTVQSLWSASCVTSGIQDPSSVCYFIPHAIAYTVYYNYVVDETINYTRKAGPGGGGSH